MTEAAQVEPVEAQNATQQENTEASPPVVVSVTPDDIASHYNKTVRPLTLPMDSSMLADFQKRIKERDEAELKILLMTCGLHMSSSYEALLQLAFEGNTKYARAFDAAFDRLYQSDPAFAQELTCRHAPVLFASLMMFFVQNRDKISPPNEVFKLQFDASSTEDGQTKFISTAAALYDAVCEHGQYPESFFGYFKHAKEVVCKTLVNSYTLPIVELAGLEDESTNPRLLEVCSVLNVLCNVEDHGPLHPLRCARAFFEARADLTIDKWYSYVCDSSPMKLAQFVSGVVNKCLARLQTMGGISQHVKQLYTASAFENTRDALKDAAQLGQGAGLTQRSDEKRMMQSFSRKLSEFNARLEQQFPVDPRGRFEGDCMIFSALALSRMRNLLGALHESEGISRAIPEKQPDVYLREYQVTMATMVTAGMLPSFEYVSDYIQSFAILALKNEVTDRLVREFKTTTSRTQTDEASALAWVEDNVSSVAVEQITRDMKALCDAAFTFDVAEGSAPTRISSPAVFLGLSLVYLLLNARMLRIENRKPETVQEWRDSMKSRRDERVSRPLFDMMDATTRAASGIGKQEVSCIYALLAIHGAALYDAFLTTDLGQALSIFESVPPTEAGVERAVGAWQVSRRAREAYAPRLVSDESYGKLCVHGPAIVWTAALFAPEVVANVGIVPQNKKDKVTKAFWCPFLTCFSQRNIQHIKQILQTGASNTYSTPPEWVPPPPSSEDDDVAETPQ